MIRIGICDDEAVMCRKIKNLAVSFLSQKNREAEFFLFASGEEVLEWGENLEKRMDGRFFKCHRSYLINLKHLKSCSDKAAYMWDGTEIPVSRLRKKEFSSTIMEYMKEGRG